MIRIVADVEVLEFNPAIHTNDREYLDYTGDLVNISITRWGSLRLYSSGISITILGRFFEKDSDKEIPVSKLFETLHDLKNKDNLYIDIKEGTQDVMVTCTTEGKVFAFRPFKVSLW